MADDFVETWNKRIIWNRKCTIYKLKLTNNNSKNDNDNGKNDMI